MQKIIALTYEALNSALEDGGPDFRNADSNMVRDDLLSCYPALWDADPDMVLEAVKSWQLDNQVGGGGEV